MKTPLLSIGLIFRDDIRCIERCLKALQPLRDAIPCELVMADTGSEDGSRQMAAQYADILFDFPWIDDFAAARNAVMDRCSGQWFLSVDTDEYLDGDCSELVRFLTSKMAINLCRVVIRNYDTYEMDGAYSDFLTVRLVRLSTGARYEGIVHESWTGLEKAGPVMRLMRTVFHHDGYVNMGQNTKKVRRNMTLLREKLRQNPDNLLVYLQMIESGSGEKDYEEIIRKAVSLVRQKAEDWQFYGPPVLRHAVITARSRNLPEFQEWAAMAQEWFPDSYFTRIDVACQMLLRDFTEEKYADCVAWGKAVQGAYDDYFAGRGDLNCQAFSTLRLASPYYQRNMQMLLAYACIEEGRGGEARALLEGLDCAALDKSQVENLLKTLCILQSRSNEDTGRIIRSLWEGLSAAAPGKAGEKRKGFLSIAGSTFSPSYRASESAKANFCRPAYTVFLPLGDQCVMGCCAAILESRDPAEMEALLGTVENWAELPVSALSHALRAGVPFPLPGRIFCLEELDGLTAGLAQSGEDLSETLKRAAGEDFAAGWQSLLWARSLALAAVQNCGWKDERQGMELARTFVKVEEAFLTRCYAPEVLQEKNLYVLPPMHRFGWYCAQAFKALEAGVPREYVYLLHLGLQSYEGAKPMAEFLLEHTPELQEAKPTPELLALAEKVRSMLAAYPADDPAVAGLKASPAYQKVAYLIEGSEP